MDVRIVKLNNVFLKVFCDEGIQREIQSKYTFLVPNAKYHPLVKKKLWDGKKKLFNLKYGTLYMGLLFDLKKSLKDMGYSYSDETDQIEEINPEDIDNYCQSLQVTNEKGEPIRHRDYQVASTYIGLKFKRRVILSPTASGKSLIVYTLMRAILDEVPGKILIIEPRIGLVKQIFGDFADYSKINKFDVEENCHIIYGGQDKDTKKRVYISTYQSIYKLDEDYFRQFSAVIIDETHNAKSDSFVKILEKCINAEYRIGLTGTLDGWETNEMVIQGLLGKVTRVASTSKLMERGDLADLDIKIYELIYDKETKKNVAFNTYEDEIKWLIGYKKRNHYICQLANHLEGNVLILYQYVDKHGKILHEILEGNSDKTLHLIHGGVDVDIREDVRAILEKSNNNIVVASMGTFSTGVNIKNIHHIILASSTKSVVKVLQSIGRGLRKGDTKDKCTVHDITDNLIKKSKQNFSLKHCYERIEIYNTQKFNYTITKVPL